MDSGEREDEILLPSSQWTPSHKRITRRQTTGNFEGKARRELKKRGVVQTEGVGVLGLLRKIQQNGYGGKNSSSGVVSHCTNLK